ncbi:MAG: hypothetical protein AMJ53_13445 [Gammaproteobacteria bacterium SG8_11]|nr:MAG: hypothetical protein AMJ53_13445 [Gammaproteobacteria bacterium SG8_11]
MLTVWAIFNTVFHIFPHIENEFVLDVSKVLFVFLLIMFLAGLMALVLGFIFSIYAVATQRITKDVTGVFFLSCIAVIAMLYRLIVLVPSIY